MNMLPNYDHINYALELKPKDYIVICGYEQTENQATSQLNGMPVKVNASSPSEAIARVERFALNFAIMEGQAFGISTPYQIIKDLLSGDDKFNEVQRKNFQKILDDNDLLGAYKEITEVLLETHFGMSNKMQDQSGKMMPMIEEWNTWMPVSYMVFEAGKEFLMFGKTREEVDALVDKAINGMSDDMMDKITKTLLEQEEE